MATGSFFNIASTVHERFGSLPSYELDVQLIPLDPDKKKPAKGFIPRLHEILKNQKSFELIDQVFPTANVGLRSHRQVGAPMVIDVDEPGTLERIEREYGPLPLTYATQTRPVSHPYKQHLYFLQTEHSAATIPKQVTCVTHTAGYDLKCNGGWGYVAAEGSTRDGETVTALHNVPIIPIPDSLVDFLREDIRKYRARNKPPGSGSAPPDTPAPTPATTLPNNSVVPFRKRTFALRSRIGTLKATGMSNDEVFSILSAHIRELFEDPEDFLSVEGKRILMKLIRETRILGARSYVYLLRHRRDKRKRKPKSPPPVATMRERFNTCPDNITPTAAREFFCIHTYAEAQRLRREFHRHGFVATGDQGSKNRVWTRCSAELSESVARRDFLSLPDSAYHSDAALQLYPDHLLPIVPQHREQEQEQRQPQPHNKEVGMNPESVNKPNFISELQSLGAHVHSIKEKHLWG
jgi:hypothetical protein